MSTINKVIKTTKKMLSNGNGLFYAMKRLGCKFEKMSDREYLEKMYAFRLGEKPDFDHPVTFNEKLQYLKLNEHFPVRSKLVDKYEVKQYIAETLGEEYVIPTLGVWDRFEDIDFDKLPDQFVMKCTHDSGGLVICRDKRQFDIEKARRKITACLKNNFYYRHREWPYKDVKPRIIAEKYMKDGDHPALIDYKIFCFDGEPEIIMTIDGGHEDESKVMRRMYDRQWNLLPVGLRGKKPVTVAEPRPEKLDDLLALARKLSAGMKHVRVDLYVISGQIYFGELTFYHMSGFEEFVPKEWDRKLGDYIIL